MCWNRASEAAEGKAGCNGDWLNLSVPLKLNSAPCTSGSSKGWGSTLFLRGWGVLMVLGRVCCGILAGGRETEREEPEQPLLA
jgi:hypothetical protein